MGIQHPPVDINLLVQDRLTEVWEDWFRSVKDEVDVNLGDMVRLTATQTLTNKTLTSPDINGGTIDGATIATSDITVGAGKTLDVSAGTLTLANNQISGDKVEGGTINALTINTLNAVVSGVTPTAGAHLATKEYVDDNVGTTIDYHFNNTESNTTGKQSETTYVMDDIIYAGEETISRDTITAASDQLLFCFDTLAGEPGGLDLAHGTYSAHFHLAVTGAGARSVDVYWTLTGTDASGNEIVGQDPIMISETQANVSGSETAYTKHAVLGSDVVLAATTRLLFKLYGNGNAGSNATMAFHVEGNSGTHVTIKAPTEIFNTWFVRQDGTTALAGPWNMGSQALTNVNIDSGTIDGATIATSDITVGAGKTLDVSAGTLTLANNQISGDKVEGGTINALTINTLTSDSVDGVDVSALASAYSSHAADSSDPHGSTLTQTTLAATNIGAFTLTGAITGGGQNITGLGALSSSTLVVSTEGNQLRIAYDGSNYCDFDVSSTAITTITPVGTAPSIVMGAHMKLFITDTDGDVEAELWYDASEDKLKFKTAGGVETITSS